MHDASLMHPTSFDPHEFKRDYVGGRISRYDICACENGSIKIAKRGQYKRSVIHKKEIIYQNNRIINSHLFSSQ